MAGTIDVATQLAAALPVDARIVLVPLDGSVTSYRALPIARQLARITGATMQCVAVASDEDSERDLTALMAGMQRAEGLAARVLPGHDAATAIAAVAVNRPGTVICMASHGRGRTAAALGSVTRDVALMTPMPMLVVGPEVRPNHHLLGPVLACVDGTTFSEAVLPVAAGWAHLLDLGLEIVTVASPHTGADLDDYIGDVERHWSTVIDPVTGRVLHDPVGVTSGILDYLAHHHAGLAAARTHARTGLGELVMGSTAAALIRHLPIPVLLTSPRAS